MIIFVDRTSILAKLTGCVLVGTCHLKKLSLWNGLQPCKCRGHRDLFKMASVGRLQAFICTQNVTFEWSEIAAWSFAASEEHTNASE